MKKILVLVCFLVGAAACATEPSGNKDTMSNTNRTMESKPMATVSEAEITAKDVAIWDALKKKDYDAFGKLLDTDYIEVEDDGVYDKPGIIAYVKDLNISDVTFSDRKMLRIDKDAVILTYNVTAKGTYKGQALPTGAYHGAAAYVNRDGQWLGIYYQQVLAQTAPPPPPPGKTESPKPPASPMSKSGETGPDAAANEKLVWDALKSRNYDAFASYLAPDAIEIEADGVHDKAGSVKGVSTFDASKAELSEWKTVKFDNDASLVTYMVRLPGMKPDQERHSTIWVNRDGKWLALFHEGTPVAVTPAAKPAATKM
jgi:hypothetical protein